ncbi:MAG: FG-GAP repeat protein [Pirellulales bacterium]
MLQELRGGEEQGKDMFGFQMAAHGGEVFIASLAMPRPDRDESLLPRGLVLAFSRGSDGRWKARSRVRVTSIGGILDGLLDGRAVPRVSGGIGNLRCELAVNGRFAAVTNSQHRVYLYQKEQTDSWKYRQQLSSEWGPPGQRTSSSVFGTSLAMDEDTLAVGEPRTRDTGLVHLYSRDDRGVWKEAGRVTGGQGEEFGSAVAIHENTLVVGAPADNEYGREAGSVYVYERAHNSEWRRTAKLKAADIAPDDSFGISVAVEGDTILAGNVGTAAYVFKRSGGGWREAARLSADVPKDAHFGITCLITGNQYFVAAPHSKGETPGCVYVFQVK